MFNNFFNVLGLLIGWRLFCFIASLAFIVITFYQIIIMLLFPCFWCAFAVLLEFIILICLAFCTIFWWW